MDEEEEWQQHTHEPDTAAAANGFPLCQGGHPQRSFTRRAALAASVVLLVVAILGAGAWYKAEQGLNRMGQDVANVIKLDAIQAHARRPEQREQRAVASVKFQDGHAMVQTVITRTLPSGDAIVLLQTQFYAQTPHGWQRTAPVAAFWGQAQELDTPDLHFVFRSEDRAAVEQLAPQLEALYTALGHALGHDLAGANDRLTVEIVPERVAPNKRFTAGSMRLMSPLLDDLNTGDAAAEPLGRRTRHTLVAQMMDKSLQARPIKEQWQPLADMLRTWLHYSDALPLAENTGTNPLPSVPHADSLRLADLLGCSPCSDPDIANGIYGKRESAASMNLFDFIVATYGLDTLPALLAGFGRYADWDTLSPAVFGVSADALDAAWHAGMTPADGRSHVPGTNHLPTKNYSQKMTNPLRHVKLGVSFTD